MANRNKEEVELLRRNLRNGLNTIEDRILQCDSEKKIQVLKGGITLVFNISYNEVQTPDIISVSFGFLMGFTNYETEKVSEDARWIRPRLDNNGVVELVLSAPVVLKGVIENERFCWKTELSKSYDGFDTRQLVDSIVSDFKKLTD
jgi:hypothetical protein